MTAYIADGRLWERSGFPCQGVVDAEGAGCYQVRVVGADDGDARPACGGRENSGSDSDGDNGGRLTHRHGRCGDKLWESRCLHLRDTMEVGCQMHNAFEI